MNKVRVCPGGYPAIEVVGGKHITLYRDGTAELHNVEAIGTVVCNVEELRDAIIRLYREQQDGS